MSKSSKKTQLKLHQSQVSRLLARLRETHRLSQSLHDEADRRAFLVKWETVEKTRSSLEEEVLAAQGLCLELHAAEDIGLDLSILDEVDDMIGEIRLAKSTLSAPSHREREVPPSAEQSIVQLPKIQLPSFSGEVKEWPIFYETFRKLVHENAALSKAEKIQHLLGRLSQGALPAISGFPPTESHYPAIWEALVERFEDKRKLSNYYVAQMFDFPPLTGGSAAQLESFVDNFLAASEALKNVGLKDLGDFLLVYLATSKLDKDTVTAFEMSAPVRGKEFPEFSDLVHFVREQRKVLDRVTPSSGMVQSPGNSGSTKIRKEPTSARSSSKPFSSQVLCQACQQPFHPLHSCKVFLGWRAEERRKCISAQRRCFNCLSSRHQASQCESASRCKVCRQKHHTLLHTDSKEPAPGTSLCHVVDQNSSSILLGTARVYVITTSGAKKPIRVLLDSASQPNLITGRCCRALNIQYTQLASTVKGMGSLPTKVAGKLSLTFSSCHDDAVRYSSEFLVVSNLADELPSIPVDRSRLSYLENTRLADPEFHLPGPVDAILGAEIFGMILRSQKLANPSSTCVALETSLGYVVLGKAPLGNQFDGVQTTLCCYHSEPLQSLVQKFWTLESFPEDSALSEDDRKCEDIFRETHKRDSSGRYTVHLPFKTNPSVLGDSFNVALRRFLLLEKRFQREPQFKDQYSNEVRKLLDNEYLAPSSGTDGYFIPHHAVLRLDSTSTPLRVVLDASSRTSTGTSLNDILYVGAKLQSDAASILLRFRLFPVAVTADIRQMFLRVLVQPDHRKYQKLLWRFNNQEPVKIYELTRVVFGMTSSPFLAQRTVRQLSEDEKHKFPGSSPYIPEDMYVDDLVASVPSLERGLNLYTDSVGLFRAGGFELVKWATNSSRLLENIPSDMRRVSSVSLDDSSSTKILGLKWNPSTDTFYFESQLKCAIGTKRSILSTLARIFDPLGFLGPVLLHMKFLLRDIWREKIDWDSPIPPELERRWQEIAQGLPSLTRLRIPRHTGPVEGSSIWLIGFCDGSTLGYGASVYLRCCSPSGSVSSILFCSKSRVAPMNKLFTVLRSELCGALLLSNLIQFILKSIEQRIKVERIIALTDSMITYQRIQSLPSKSDIFVKNRIMKIREVLTPDVWWHVPTEENAADCLSRGLPPQRLVDHNSWMTGPPWLVKEQSLWPVFQPGVGANLVEVDLRENMEQTKEQCFLTIRGENKNVNILLELISKFSKWRKILSVVVYILRFGRILKRSQSHITAGELDLAEEFIVRAIQHSYFPHEIKQLQRTQLCRPEIQKLQPFLENGLIKVGGRLKHSDLEHSQKHPVLLPNAEAAVGPLVRYYHERYLHAGPLLLVSIIRQNYWILGVRALVRKIFRKCNVCFRTAPRASCPMMGDLPSCRVRPSVPFSHTGVDYAGPFWITAKRGKGQRPHKAYVCVFVCLCVKALHLEVVADLSTASFLNAFKRFVSRRGQCEVIYSDNGKTFVGAKKALQEIFHFLAGDDFRAAWREEMAERRITWHFSPPSAPHFGGIWEANIRSIKMHLSRVIGTQVLSLEEFANNKQRPKIPWTNWNLDVI